ncbi:probable E3 ubiquitin-protein ligase RNF217 [Kryptolebias marmoratus]|uniref:RBR-type E3 ubiquitin transferase n=1 Tax=Kryptolebias marmoratus TaxID=37003 RepID=A0A3Q3B6T2_KRYMA|nr:probable E3 ubiquitin-protein ligase RNF217 [Kryptolebias marmoratus]
MGRAKSGMEDDGPIADAFRMPSFIISNIEEGRAKLSRNLPTETSFADGKVGDSNRGVIRSNSLDEGDRTSAEERDAEGNNNNNCNGGGGGGGGRRARRRASAVEILRRNFGDSKSPSLRLSTKSRMPSGPEHGTDIESGKNEPRDGCGAECGECRKSDAGTGGPGDKNEPTPSESTAPAVHGVDDGTVRDECRHKRDNDVLPSAPGGSSGAKQHVYCTVYCVANDARRADAEAPDPAVASDGTEVGSETGRTASPGSGPELELYSLDDLVDLMGDASQRQHGDQADSGSEAECCEVCLEEKLIAPLPCCGKHLCAGCLKLYVSSQVTVGKAVIGCPNWTCHGTLEEGLVVSNLTSEEAAKYRYFVELSQLDASTKPCPQCNHFTSLKTHNPTRFEHKYKIQCSSCQFVWCFKCHAPWHDGLKCRDYRKADKQLRTWASVIEHGQRNAQKCPQCKIHIQRTEGCDHMTCTQCNTNFCYRCGERYRHLRFFGDHTSNLSVFGCKYRYLPDKPHLRRLVRGSVCASKMLITPVVLVLVVVLGALALVIGLFAFPIYYVCKRRKKQQQHTRGSGRWI